VNDYFERLGRAKVTRALNALVEAPFFYREDDRDLFAFLRKNRAAFSRFYEDLYGWELVVDARCARVYKTRWHNRALKPSQHDVFDLTTKNECIAFLLVLEFYEHLLEERNVAVDDPEPLRFLYGELFTFARRRLADELGEGAPDEEGLRRLLRELFPTLLRFRFLRRLEPDPDLRDGLALEQEIYECLPALYHYDVRLLGEGAVGRAFGGEPREASTAEGQQGLDLEGELP
jgi:hypothetical protein